MVNKTEKIAKNALIIKYGRYGMFDYSELEEFVRKHSIMRMISWVEMFEPFNGLRKVSVNDVDVVYSFLDSEIRDVHALMLTHKLVNPLTQLNSVHSLKKDLKDGKVEVLNQLLHITAREGIVFFIDRQITLKLTPLENIKETIRKYIRLLKKHNLLVEDNIPELTRYLKTKTRS